MKKLLQKIQTAFQFKKWRSKIFRLIKLLINTGKKSFCRNNTIQKHRLIFIKKIFTQIEHFFEVFWRATRSSTHKKRQFTKVRRADSRGSLALHKSYWNARFGAFSHPISHKENSELVSCFMLNMVLITVQESNTKVLGPLLRYIDSKQKWTFNQIN